MNGIDGAVRHFRNLGSWWDFRYFYLHIGYFRLHGVCIALFIALFGCFFRCRLLGGRYRALLQVVLCWAFVKMRLILLALFGLLCGLAQVYGSRSITVKILNIVVCNIRWALLTFASECVAYNIFCSHTQTNWELLLVSEYIVAYISVCPFSFEPCILWQIHMLYLFHTLVYVFLWCVNVVNKLFLWHVCGFKNGWLWQNVAAKEGHSLWMTLCRVGISVEYSSEQTYYIPHVFGPPNGSDLTGISPLKPRVSVIVW